MKWRILCPSIGCLFMMGFLMEAGCQRSISPGAPVLPVLPSVPPPTSTPTFTPTITATSTPMAYQTPTPPPNGIFWYRSTIRWEKSDQEPVGEVPSSSVGISLSVNGIADPTVIATVSTPFGTFPLGYVGTSYGYATYSACRNYVPYQAGGTYILTTVTSIGTAAATLVAPGGSVNVTPDGRTASWSLEGNSDGVWIVNSASGDTEFDSGSLFADIDSPFNIPLSAYPLSGNYDVYVDAANTATVTGAQTGFKCQIIYQGDFHIVR